jgi:hypothetical protein
LCYESVLRAVSNNYDFDKFKEDILEVIPSSNYNKLLPSVGKNDRPFFEGSKRGKRERIGLKKYYGIMLEKDQEGDLIKACKSLLTRIPSDRIDLKKITIQCKFSQEEFIIGNDEITGLQIFKCDRYSGFTATDVSVYSQITVYCSPEISILLLSGLASSFIMKRMEKSIGGQRRGRQFFYFLFFSPEEVLKLYCECDNVRLIKKYFNVKDKVIEFLRSYLVSSLNEIILTELALNLELQDLLSKSNLDKISFILFKIALEGNTYKIYEQIPITVYRRIILRDIIGKYFRDPDEFIEELSKIVKNKTLLEALESLSNQKLKEADNVLRAITSLYRFVVLGDLQEYYQFMRELSNCHRMLTEEKEHKRKEEYRKILSNLGRF